MIPDVALYALPCIYQIRMNDRQISESISDPQKIDGIVRYISNSKRIALKDLQGHTKEGLVVYCRQLIMYVLRKRTSLSFKRIGGMFGDRDHTTVIHSMKVIRNYLDTDQGKRVEIERFTRMIY